MSPPMRCDEMVIPPWERIVISLTFLAKPPTATAMETNSVGRPPGEFWACAQPTTTPRRPLHLIRHHQDPGMAAATCTRDGNRQFAQFPEQEQGCDLQVEAA